MHFSSIFIVFFYAINAVINVCLAFHDRPIVLVFASSDVFPGPKGFQIVPPKNDFVSDFEVITQTNDDNANSLIRRYSPDCILSFSDEKGEDFPRLNKLPQSIRSKWIHYDILETNESSNFWDRVSSDVLNTMVNAWLVWPHPLLNNPKGSPLFSIFTPSLHGGEKLHRVASSLKRQTYDNWQWVVVVDDPDDSNTITVLDTLADKDCRIEYWIPDKRSGVIGTRKRQAAMLAKGDILVEMDHDDQLMDDALEGLLAAFAAQPDVGFVYTDFSEPYWETNLSTFVTYGEDFPFHYDTWQSGAPDDSPQHVRWFLATGTAPLQHEMLQYLTRLPNHIRAWRADVYRQLNGHRDLIVADDHELLLRTYMTTRWMYWDKMEYLQYRNVEKDNNQPDNFTFKRNSLIQWIRELSNEWYRKDGRTQVRDKELGPGPQHLEWGFRIERKYPGNMTAILPISNDDSLSSIQIAYQSAEEYADEVVLVFPENMSRSFSGSFWQKSKKVRQQLLGVPEATYPTRLHKARRGWEVSQSPIVAYIYPGNRWSKERIANAIFSFQKEGGPSVWTDAASCNRSFETNYVIHRRSAPWRRNDNHDLYSIIFEGKKGISLSNTYTWDQCGVQNLARSSTPFFEKKTDDSSAQYVAVMWLCIILNLSLLCLNLVWLLWQKGKVQKTKAM